MKPKRIKTSIIWLCKGIFKERIKRKFFSNSEIGGYARGRGKIIRGRGGKFCPSRNSDSSNSTNCLENENSFQASSNTNYYQYTDPKLIQTSCIGKDLQMSFVEYIYRTRRS